MFFSIDGLFCIPPRMKFYFFPEAPCSSVLSLIAPNNKAVHIEKVVLEIASWCCLFGIMVTRHTRGDSISFRLFYVVMMTFCSVGSRSRVGFFVCW
jgi:hypothetical protein